jgi:hypothetical protein
MVENQSSEVENKKAMRGKRMAENLELLAPYGGMTRIRFKGSSNLSDLSASGSPAFPER